MAKGGKGVFVLAFIGFLVGASGLGFGAYIYITYEQKMDYLDDQIDDLKDDVEAIDDSLPVDTNDTDSDSSLNDSGKILQTKKVSSRSIAYITDGDETKTEMAAMNIQITTEGESYLVMRFFTQLYLVLPDDFKERVDFNISIEFEGQGVCECMIHHYVRPGPLGNETDITYPIYLEHITDTLSAGTYNVKIVWYSIQSNPDCYVMLVASRGSLTPLRTLIVQEISS
ncbi:MAG: hypothetical protein BAJALOKI2v1_800017 [Promethearchaeota archaeon]|nr:MAG: hypothetical protein BAJALOKI2v1_800017 [Candidatus Lokiarchaeota archaeon]